MLRNVGGGSRDVGVVLRVVMYRLDWKSVDNLRR